MDEGFIVSETKRKEVIAYVRKNHPDIGKIRICDFICGIFYAVMVIIGIIGVAFTCYIIYEDLSDFSEETALFLIMVFAAFVIPDLTLYLFPVYIQRFRNHKYLNAYYGKKLETVVFTTNTMVWGAWAYMGKRHSLANKPYEERMIRYKDLERVEYDEMQKVYRIYGLYDSKIWEGPKNYFLEGRTANEFVKDLHNFHQEYLLDFPAMVIPDYFDDEGEIKRVFEEKLGERFVIKNRRYDEYHMLYKQKEKERKETWKTR